jgi:hypothetical protein
VCGATAFPPPIRAPVTIPRKLRHIRVRSRWNAKVFCYDLGAAVDDTPRCELESAVANTSNSTPIKAGGTMHKFNQTFRKIAAVAIVGAIAAAGTVQLARAQAPEKKVKDQGEFDIYNQALKDAKDTSNPGALIKDLDQWTQKYPESDYKDDRLAMYVGAYNAANQPSKVLEVVNGLLARDIKSVFMKDPKTGPSQVLQVLYLGTLNFAKIPNPAPEEVTIGEKVIKALIDYVPEYFVAANKPANSSDADWAKTKGQVEDLAKGVMLSRATRPAAEAMAKYRADTANKNPAPCSVAEAAYLKALQQYPDNPAIAYGLATAEICLYKVTPEKINMALWMMARAVAIDPTLGGTADAAQIERYLNSTYTQYHGGDDAGLKQLKEQAKASLMPPADFKIKPLGEIMHEKEVEFEKSNPQLAMWMRIKGQLAEGGDQYFESQLKSADVPPLKGTLLEAKPACRPKELVLALSDPTHSEVTLKLDAALTGKPETGTEMQFKGVPSAFSKEPFMLTMDAEKANLEGLKMSPCTAAPAKKSGPPATKKK